MVVVGCAHSVAPLAFNCHVDAHTLLVLQIKGPNVPKDALAGGGDLPDTAGLDTLGKIANKAGEKVSSQCVRTSCFLSVTTNLRSQQAVEHSDVCT